SAPEIVTKKAMQRERIRTVTFAEELDNRAPRKDSTIVSNQRLLSLAKEGADRLVNCFLVFDMRENQVLVITRDFFQFANIVAGAIGTFDLAVTDQVAHREKIFLQCLEATGVVFTPIITVRELEDVDIPIGWRKVAFHDFLRLMVGRRN